jgi:hypothetical protein
MGDLELAAMHGMKGLQASEPRPNAMHDWLDNIESEFAWLKDGSGRPQNQPNNQ